jgi:hypothetical protein
MSFFVLEKAPTLSQNWGSESLHPAEGIQYYAKQLQFLVQQLIMQPLSL